MQGVGTAGTTLFALFCLAADAPITKGQEVKIVWRMTGAGWVFPGAGCWTVHATRAGSGDATLTLRVA
jgi:hypothetical protein